MTDYLEIVREVMARQEARMDVGYGVMRREVARLVQPVFGTVHFGKQAREIIARYLATHKLTDSERLSLSKRLYSSMAGRNGMYVAGRNPRYVKMREEAEKARGAAPAPPPALKEPRARSGPNARSTRRSSKESLTRFMTAGNGSRFVMRRCGGTVLGVSAAGAARKTGSLSTSITLSRALTIQSWSLISTISRCCAGSAT